MPDTVCYRHEERSAAVRCQRCERVICPSCMHQASVGFHCPECVGKGKQRVYTARTLQAANRPLVTTTLIALNVAVFLADIVTGSSPGGGRGSSGLTLDGGLTACLPVTACAAGFEASDGVIGVDVGEWYRIVTSGFLHDGLIHIGFNMLVLWVLGQQLEPALGRLRFALVYGVGLLAGSFGVLLLSPTAFTVGASGAVFALFGAAVVLQRSQGINPFETGLGGLVMINLAITFLLPGISIGGHLGGLLGGAAVGAILVELPRRLAPGSRPLQGSSPTLVRVVPVSAAVALGIALIAGSLWAASQWPTGGLL